MKVDFIQIIWDHHEPYSQLAWKNRNSNQHTVYKSKENILKKKLPQNKVLHITGQFYILTTINETNRIFIGCLIFMEGRLYGYAQ